MKVGTINDNGTTEVLIKDQTQNGMYVVERIDGQPFSNELPTKIVTQNEITNIRDVILKEEQGLKNNNNNNKDKKNIDNNKNNNLSSKAFKQSLPWLILLVFVAMFSLPNGLLLLVIYPFIYRHNLNKLKSKEEEEN